LDRVRRTSAKRVVVREDRVLSTATITRPRRSPLALVLIIVVACGSDKPTIVCLGDSITEGVTRVGSADSAGGYPGRLQRRLGDRARIVNRGVGGASTRLWLLDHDAAVREPKWWARFHDRWQGPPPRSGQPLVDAVLEADRPDIVVVLLGVNDLYYEGKVTAAADLVDQIAERMETIAAKARAIGATVWIATALPNRRDPEALVDALNTRIRARADDYFPVGERFAEQDWRHLLADDVHPTEDGYQVLADIVAQELVRHGQVPP
jgi:lysophospholipase L1-like esterase